MSDLREALDRYDAIVPASSRPDALNTVLAAARRFLALTETGPDYEAAKKADCIHWPENTECWRGHDIEHIVDAALADYLTEEET